MGGELNYLDGAYLEFSMASDIFRGLMVWGGLLCLAIAVPLGGTIVPPTGVDNWIVFVGVVITVIAVTQGVFFLRFDLRLPKDRPVRFNRRRRKVYANTYTWNHNPFGHWRGGVKVFDWDTLQAEVTKQYGASGEVLTQRYNLDLVVCRPGTEGRYEEVERFRLQHGAQTTGQYAEQWEFIRRYMNHGLQGLPEQTLRESMPGLVDSLMFMMPWFAPTAAGRQFRERHRHPLVVLFLCLMALPFPLWLIFGVGHYIVMRVAPDAVWPSGIDQESKS